MAHSKKNKAKLRERELFMKAYGQVPKVTTLLAGPVRIKQLEDLIKEYKLDASK